MGTNISKDVMVWEKWLAPNESHSNFSFQWRGAQSGSQSRRTRTKNDSQVPSCRPPTWKETAPAVEKQINNSIAKVTIKVCWLILWLVRVFEQQCRQLCATISSIQSCRQWKCWNQSKTGRWILYCDMFRWRTLEPIWNPDWDIRFVFRNDHCII